MKEQDCLRRFLFEELGIRGKWVRLHKSWEETKQHQKISTDVQEQLGQALAAVVMLSATIKFEGSMIFQAQGNGSLKALVAQSTHDKKVHGLARCDATTKGTLPEMIGDGRLVITVAPNKGNPYQGIVPLDKNTLADSVTHYFLQSEQLETRVWLFANTTHAAGLFLQKIPTKNASSEDWDRITLLANTVTQDEILTLNCEEILYRLFNEEKVNLFEPEEVTFKCGCSLQKIKVTLATIGREELEGILKTRETIDVDCEFCSQRYSFNKIDITNILSGQMMSNASNMQH